MRTVYRYEDRNGLGPFNHEGLNRMMAQLPTPRDVGMNHRRGWRYGGESIIDLNNYFGSYTRILEQYGYELVRYDVADDAVIGSEGQVMFNPTQTINRVNLDAEE